MTRQYTQRRPFTKDELNRIIRLMRETDIPYSAIGIRFNRSTASIQQLSRKLGIRRTGRDR